MGIETIPHALQPTAAATAARPPAPPQTSLSAASAVATRPLSAPPHPKPPESKLQPKLHPMPRKAAPATRPPVATSTRPPSAKATASKAPASKAPASKAPASKAPASKAPESKAPAKALAPTPAAKSVPPRHRASSAAAAGTKAPVAALDLSKDPAPAMDGKDPSASEKAAQVTGGKKPAADSISRASAKAAAVKAADVAALAAERAEFDSLLERASAGLVAKLRDVERDIEQREEEYISKTWAHGNVMRGWDGFVRRVDRGNKAASGTGSGTATGAPKYRKARPSDRIFSLSSSTSNFRRENPDVLIQKRPPDKKKKKKR